MSFIRSILPSFINNNIMYYVGKTQCYIQQYCTSDYTPSKMTDRIYVGSLADASHKGALKNTGITHVISVMNGVYELYPDDFIAQLPEFHPFMPHSIQLLSECYKDPNVSPGIL